MPTLHRCIWYSMSTSINDHNPISDNKTWQDWYRPTLSFVKVFKRIDKFIDVKHTYSYFIRNQKLCFRKHFEVFCLRQMFNSSYNILLLLSSVLIETTWRTSSRSSQLVYCTFFAILAQSLPPGFSELMLPVASPIHWCIWTAFNHSDWSSLLLGCSSTLLCVLQSWKPLVHISRTLGILRKRYRWTFLLHLRFVRGSFDTHFYSWRLPIFHHQFSSINCGALFFVNWLE